MLYKRSISVIVFILLILTILVALWFLRQPTQKAPMIDLSNRVHTSLYQNASGIWEARIATSPFEPSPSTMVHLAWQKPTDLYAYFLITVTDAESGWTRTESGEHDRVTLDVPDLLPDTLYTFVVQACLDRNCSSWLIADTEATGKTQPENDQTSTTSNASP